MRCRDRMLVARGPRDERMESSVGVVSVENAGKVL